MVAWGAGTNTTAQPHFSQSRIPIGLSNAVAVIGGGYHSLGLITDGSPFVVRQPWGWSIETGDSVSLSVGALGMPTLSYQWEFNGSALLGETNAMLVHTNFALSSSGDNQCVVTNDLGFTRSLSAILNFMRTSPEL